MNAPTPEFLEARYRGKPFLKFVDAFVLDAIVGLAAEEERLLSAMAPKLAKVFQTAGTWQEIVAAALGVPANIAEPIRQQWRQAVAAAAAKGVTLEPLQFVYAFVDANLAPNDE